MSSNLVRLNSGDVIQIRTGVLQGIGPSGPTGPIGPAGDVGPVGPQGVPGPMGLVDDYYTQVTSVGSPQSVGPLTDTLVSFGTVNNDDASLVASVTNFALPLGLWSIQVSLVFQKPSAVSASGHRRITVYYNGTLFETNSQNAIPGYDTAFAARCLVDANAAGRIVTVKAFHSDAVAVSVYGVATLTRIGPGAPGDDGPVGPAGPAGVIGPTGPQGPAGSLISNTTTIAAIGG